MPGDGGKFRLEWNRLAEADLDAIQAYVSEHSSAGAERVWLRIMERVEQLRDFPLAAPAFESRPELRVLVVPGTPYLVLYRVRGDAVRIEAVLHGAQERPSQ